MQTQAQLEAEELLDEMKNVEPLRGKRFASGTASSPRIIPDRCRRGSSASLRQSAWRRARFAVAKMRKASRWFGSWCQMCPAARVDQGMGRCRPAREPV